VNIFNFKAISTKRLFTNKKIAIVSVINDLSSDVRVAKTVQTLIDLNFEVILIGRILPNSQGYHPKNHRAIRMMLLFKKGPLFYVFFNFRLFCQLLWRKADLLYANDLDTLAPNFVVSNLRGIRLVYDSHELFCEVPELLHSPLKRRTWLALEKWILPKLNNPLTVSEGIAEFYQKKYGCRFTVVRNMPPSIDSDFVAKSREALGIDVNKKMILLQGAGINIDRGAEELIEAMTMVHHAVLYIIGSGDVWQQLEQKVLTLKLSDKIKLIKKLPKSELLHYTANADLGLSIDKNTNLNYYFSLPNKVFDYINGAVPVLASRLHELEKIITPFRLGEFIDSHDPAHMAEKINHMLESAELTVYKANTFEAKRQLNWTNERLQLIAVINKAMEQAHKQ
jgi:glycosyltransferase involved in cell wall biosynthesis